jgi:predicted  nucleic acid-binding Zn-ribbon protein
MNLSEMYAQEAHKAMVEAELRAAAEAEVARLREELQKTLDQAAEEHASLSYQIRDLEEDKQELLSEVRQLEYDLEAALNASAEGTYDEGYNDGYNEAMKLMGEA